jgi:hypothetical protein
MQLRQLAVKQFRQLVVRQLKKFECYKAFVLQFSHLAVMQLMNL